MTTSKISKPKLYRCTRRKLWLCILDHVQGEGTTKRHAFLSWRAQHNQLT